MNLSYIKNKLESNLTNNRADAAIYLLFLYILVGISKVVLFIDNCILDALGIISRIINTIFVLIHDAVIFAFCVIAETIVIFKLPFFTSVLSLYIFDAVSETVYLTPINILFTTVATKLLMVLFNLHKSNKDSKDED